MIVFVYYPCPLYVALYHSSEQYLTMLCSIEYKAYNGDKQLKLGSEISCYPQSFEYLLMTYSILKPINYFELEDLKKKIN